MKSVIQRKFKKSNNAVIGFFNAVHIGHSLLIKKAKKQKGSLTVFTFDKKPTDDVVITDLKTREELLKKLGADKVIVLKFDEVKNLAPEEFIKKYLLTENIENIFIGQDFRFGKNRVGTPANLEKHFNVYKMKLKEKHNKKISSSDLSKAITERDLTLFKNLTGRNYKLTGKVCKGKQIARTLGFPTANINTKYILPGDGVYYSLAYVDGKKYPALAVVSKSPTLTKQRISKLEVHIYKFDQDIYCKTIQVEFKKLMRDIYKLSTIQALERQIRIDVKKGKRFFKI